MSEATGQRSPELDIAEAEIRRLKARIEYMADMHNDHVCEISNQSATIRTLQRELQDAREAELSVDGKAMVAKGSRVVAWLWEAWSNGGTLDGGDIQEYLVKEGLVERVPYDPGKHGTDFDAAEYMEPGDDYFVASDMGRALLNAARVRAV
jgi:hypothetical protein